MTQFTLARLLLAITLICLALGFWGIDPNLSGLALLALAAWGLALLAIRGAWRNAAFALTAFGAGLLWPLAVALPLSAANHYFAPRFPTLRWPYAAAS